MQLLAAIVDSSDDVIISKDLDGIIPSWNMSAERVFGYTAAETIGQSVTMLIPPDRLNEEREITAQIGGPSNTPSPCGPEVFHEPSQCVGVHWPRLRVRFHVRPRC